MLSNEFRLFGVIVTDFEDVEYSEKFPKKSFKIEVEKKSRGKVATYTVIIYSSNTSIDISKSLNGKTVIVNGYLDCYNDFVKLIAQEIYIVGVGKPRVKEVVVKPEEPKVLEPAEEIVEVVDNVDDDLPF